jgi:hypothetical protein
MCNFDAFRGGMKMATLQLLAAEGSFRSLAVAGCVAIASIFHRLPERNRGQTEQSNLANVPVQ